MLEVKQNEFYSPLPNAIRSVMLGGMGLCIVFAGLYYTKDQGWMLSCAVTFGTTAYHIAIRLLSPVLLTVCFHKKYNYRAWWFQQKKWESAFYERIKVKRWKRKVFTYDPSQFSTKIHSFEEIVNNMCHAEAVHELNGLLSFTSLLFAVIFGTFFVFLITAILAALFDLIFVIIQRYNRPRVIVLMERGRTWTKNGKR